MGEWLVSALARRSGVPASTLLFYERGFYERAGLLPAARTPSGYRVFDDQTEQRLDFISAAKRLKLPMPAIAELLTIWQAQSCRSVKAQLRPAIDARIADAEAGIAELTALRNQLLTAREELDELPDRDERCDPNCSFLRRSKEQP